MKKPSKKSPDKVDLKDIILECGPTFFSDVRKNRTEEKEEKGSEKSKRPMLPRSHRSENLFGMKNL